MSLEDLLKRAQFTPGPWEVPHLARDDVSCNCASVVCEGYAGAVATIGVDNGKPIDMGGNDCPPLAEAKSNARLIAAAPDMFEALRNLLAATDPFRPIRGTDAELDARQKAVAALLRALISQKETAE